jgi:hypothetical protein
MAVKLSALNAGSFLPPMSFLAFVSVSVDLRTNGWID